MKNIRIATAAVTALCLLIGISEWSGGAFESSAMAQQAKPKPKPATNKGAKPPVRDGGTTPTITRESASSSGASADSGIVESKTTDGGTRVFRFGELEVEGRLRSPQIVYFLRRVRAEFAAGDLGHRSFMGELSQTRNAAAF